MGLLTREAFLSASPNHFPREVVPVPELGGDVLVQGLNATELDDFEQSRLVQSKGKVKLNLKNTRARLCALTIVDEQGKRLFAETDVPRLGRLPGKVLDRIYEVAAKLSGIKDEDLEDVAKNSELAPSSD